MKMMSKRTKKIQRKQKTAKTLITHQKRHRRRPSLPLSQPASAPSSLSSQFSTHASGPNTPAASSPPPSRPYSPPTLPLVSHQTRFAHLPSSTSRARLHPGAARGLTCLPGNPALQSQLYKPFRTPSAPINCYRQVQLRIRKRTPMALMRARKLCNEDCSSHS